MPTTELHRQIMELGPWFHNLHFPSGEQTAPDHFLGDFPAYKWQEIAPILPDDLTGVRALDIGCNGGYYSFELARRGASVTAVDIDEHYLRQGRWAAHALGLQDRVKFRQATVYELAHRGETFDLIWFMGVMYHLRYPMLALDIARRCCRGRMIFQTMTMPGDEEMQTASNYELQERQLMTQPGWPKLAFIEHQVANDPTNWWAANHAGVKAMLRASGFGNIERIAHEIYTCEVTDTSPAAIAELESVLSAHQV